MKLKKGKNTKTNKHQVINIVVLGTTDYNVALTDDCDGMRRSSYYLQTQNERTEASLHNVLECRCRLAKAYKNKIADCIFLKQ